LNDQDILIVGGYGVVGLRIAPDIGSDYPGRVVVAGRSLARADNAARGIGHGVRGRKRSGAAAPSRAGAVSDDDGRLAGAGLAHEFTNLIRTRKNYIGSVAHHPRRYQRWSTLRRPWPTPPLPGTRTRAA